jgi:hypothetical protein
MAFLRTRPVGAAPKIRVIVLGRIVLPAAYRADFVMPGMAHLETATAGAWEPPRAHNPECRKGLNPAAEDPRDRRSFAVESVVLVHVCFGMAVR